MEKRLRIRKEVKMLCMKLEMPRYQRSLLAEMIYQKVRHPEEETTKLLEKAARKEVPKYYKRYLKKDCLENGIETEKIRLEQELHRCKNLPEHLMRGDIIQNTVNYYYEIVCGME